MDERRRIVAVLALFAIVLAFTAPALAQGTPMASPTTISVEQSDKGMMAALADTKDAGMAASIMGTAGLGGLIKPEGKYTLFVASDAALKATSPDTMKNMMEKLKDRQFAIYFAKGHMVNGMVMPDEMAGGKALTMMNGKTMTVGTADGRLMVDDATITGAVKTTNGMIYLMDRIPSSVMAMLEQRGAASMGAMPAGT